MKLPKSGFHLHNSIKQSFSTRCLIWVALSCRPDLFQGKSKAAVGDGIGADFVLRLILVTPSSLHSFQITTDGELGSPWKAMAKWWRMVLSDDVQDFGGRYRDGLGILRHPAAHFSILVHFCLPSSEIKKKKRKKQQSYLKVSKLLGSFSFSRAIALHLVWNSHISFDYPPYCMIGR